MTATPAQGSAFNGWSGACTGTASCVVTIDSAKSVTAQFAVTPVNTPPAANSQALNTHAGEPLGIVLSAVDADAGQTLTYRVVTPPAHGSLSGDAPALTYTPADAFVGRDSFTFVADDGQASSSEATVTIDVARGVEEPDPPAGTFVFGAVDQATGRRVATAETVEGERFAILGEHLSAEETFPAISHDGTRLAVVHDCSCAGRAGERVHTRRTRTNRTGVLRRPRRQ